MICLNDLISGLRHVSDAKKTHKNPNLRRTSQDNADGASFKPFCDEHFIKLCTFIHISV